MAEAAAVASIVGIASFGIQLTQSLYRFGSNVASAREETAYIARHIDLYANVLDILTERIDDEEPILSDAAFDLIDELHYQSNKLFDRIKQTLPSPKNGKDDISFLQRVKWNFQKSKVALLVGELDYLRSIVHLLVTVIFTGRKIRSHRRRKAKSSKHASQDLNYDLQNQSRKAQNALLAHYDALEKLPVLKKEAKRQEETNSGQLIRISSEESKPQTDIAHTSTVAFAELQQSLAVYTDAAERQYVIMQQSGQVLQELLQRWTTVERSTSPEDTDPERQPQWVEEEERTANIENQRPSNPAMSDEELARDPPTTFQDSSSASSVYQDEPEADSPSSKSQRRAMKNSQNAGRTSQHTKDAHPGKTKTQSSRRKGSDTRQEATDNIEQLFVHTSGTQSTRGPATNIRREAMFGDDFLDRIYVRINDDEHVVVHFPPYWISEERTKVRDLRRQVAKFLRVQPAMVDLFYKGQKLANDDLALKSYNLKFKSEVTARMVGRE